MEKPGSLEKEILLLRKKEKFTRPHDFSYPRQEWSHQEVWPRDRVLVLSAGVRL